MVTKWTCAYLQRRWRGPALRVAVNGRVYPFGDGTPRTEVVIHRSGLMPWLVLSPSLAFGEAYMRGEIEVHGSLMDVLEGAHRTFAPAQPNQPSTRPGRKAPSMAKMPIATSFTACSDSACSGAAARATR